MSYGRNRRCRHDESGTGATGWKVAGESQYLSVSSKISYDPGVMYIDHNECGRYLGHEVAAAGTENPDN